jgi:hypothetical protein
VPCGHELLLLPTIRANEYQALPLCEYVHASARHFCEEYLSVLTFRTAGAIISCDSILPAADAER